jgi:hypothetical protein
MKKSLLVLALLASTTANAEVVKVAGYGDNYSQAVANCELTAIKKVTGTWIASEKRLSDGKYSEEIAAYGGAVINYTHVLSYAGNAVVCEVDVDPVKDNKVITKENEVPVKDISKLNRDAKEFNKALEFVDQREKALKAIVNDVTYKPMGDHTNVYVDVSVVWDPKWVSDVKTLLKKRGIKGDTTSNLGNELLGSVINVFATSGHPIFASVAGDLMYETHQTSDDNMICFAKKAKHIADDCYETIRPLKSFHDRSIKIVGEGVDANGDRVEWFIHKIEVKDLYEILYPNKTKGHNGLLNSKVTYLSPGIAIYTDEKQRVQFGFQIDSDRLEMVKKFKFVIE